MKRVLLWVFILLLVLLVLLPALASYSHIGAVLTHLPAGWWHFLQRNLPQLTFNWHMILTAVLCSSMVLYLGHGLLGAVYRQARQSRHPDQTAAPWRWGWTVSLFAAMWLLFAIAFGSAGLLRHTTWLMDYHGPWYEERLNAYAELLLMSGLIEQCVLENKGDLEKVHKAFWSERSRREGTLMLEQFNVIFYAQNDKKVADYIIIPRSYKLLKKGLFFVSSSKKFAVQPVSALPKTINEFESKYPLKR